MEINIPLIQYESIHAVLGRNRPALGLSKSHVALLNRIIVILTPYFVSEMLSFFIISYSTFSPVFSTPCLVIRNHNNFKTVLIIFFYSYMYMYVISIFDSNGRITRSMVISPPTPVVTNIE